MSALADHFAFLLRAHNLSIIFQREYKFHPARKWRFDFADPERKIAVEIDGGVFVKGRHSRGAGYRSDCEKLNAAAALGWRVFKYVERKGMPHFFEDYQTIVDRETMNDTRRSALISAKANAQFILDNIEALQKLDTPQHKHEKAARSFSILLRNGEELTPGQYSYLESIYEMVMGAKGLPSVKVHSDRKRKSLKFG